jgi:hypothetical protein
MRRAVGVWLLILWLSSCDSNAGNTGGSATSSPSTADSGDSVTPKPDAGAIATGGAGAKSETNGSAPNDAKPNDRNETPSDANAPSADSEDAGTGDAPPSAAASTIAIGATTVLAPLVGRMATPAPAQEDIGFYGTDLGRSTVHKGGLRLLFGDTSRAPGTEIDRDYDDVQGEISLLDFPDGPSVDAYVAAHPPQAGRPSWQAAAPPVTLLTRDGTVAGLIPFRDSEPLPMSLGRTPVAVWSDGGDGLFAIFNRIAPLACAASEPRCPNGFVCDEGLGAALGAQMEGAMPCVIGTDLGCAAVASGGYCQDPSSSTYDRSNPSARRMSVVYQEELGNEVLTEPGHYRTTVFSTNKFINPCARTVSDFDPARKDGAGNVYTAATGSLERAKVLLWGRPWFSGARGRDARLYLQYFDIPKYDPSGRFDLQPHYFTHVAAGVPQFSTREIDARPLDLSYPDGDPTTEQYDVVGELSISWIEPLQKWLMLYGGQYGPGGLLVMQGAGASEVQPDLEGGISIRVADQPWGPWSAPQHVLRARTKDDAIVPLTAAPNGILARPDCTTPDCPSSEPNYPSSERGEFYSAHLIEPWTTARDAAVDVYWVVSTWNPYQVVLLKTELRIAR